jgi:nucleotide-binding universal stress UspA family protein
MKSAVIAVEPVVANSELSPKPPKSFGAYARLIDLFQRKGLIPRSSIASMIHSSLYMVPISWYAENEKRYAWEAQNEVESRCLGLFEFDIVKVLRSSASANHFLIEQLGKYVGKLRSDLLVVLSSNRSGVPYWLLGSFAETAAFTAPVSVLVLKPQIKEADLSRHVRLLVAVDAEVDYSSEEKASLVQLAQSSGAHVDLVYSALQPRVELVPLRRSVGERETHRKLESLASEFKKAGISTSSVVLKEVESVAQAIVDFADKRQSWMIVTISVERGPARKLLLGSTARRILSITKRPFLSLRVGNN